MSPVDSITVATAWGALTASGIMVGALLGLFARLTHGAIAFRWPVSSTLSILTFKKLNIRIAVVNCRLSITAIHVDSRMVLKRSRCIVDMLNQFDRVKTQDVGKKC
jgi:hypothetical protein